MHLVAHFPTFAAHARPGSVLGPLSVAPGTSHIMAPPTTLLSRDSAELQSRTSAPLASEGLARASSDLGALPALLELAKPGVTRLVLVTTLCGAAIAPGPLLAAKLLWALVGTAGVVASANAFNMVLERDVDGLMDRTSGRPLPSGRLSREAALAFAVACGLGGLVALLLAVNLATTMLATLALGSYVWLYTPLKRHSPWALHVGAVPGAVPPVIGWAAMTGSVDAAAMSLFAILFVWQIPHFYAISIFRRDDYARAGLAVLSVVLGTQAAKRSAFLWSILLALVSLLPIFVGLGGEAYPWIAAASGVAFVAWIARGLSRHDERAWARSTFFASMPHLVLLFGALVFGAH